MRNSRFDNRNNFRKQRSHTGRTFGMGNSNSALARTIESHKGVSNYAEPEQEQIKHRSFGEFTLCDQLIKNISAKNYSLPTPIQDQAIPFIIEGRDVIGIANTGTGKTGAFLVPLINKVYRDRGQKVLIIAPTRELALQIYGEFKDFARGMNLYGALAVGGMDMNRQKNDLRRNPNFVISTPGRLKDFIQLRVISLEQFNNVVLDEADRMVDIGFIADIKYFISLLPQVRQSLFFSATISSKVSEILQAFVKNPVSVSVKKHDTVANIEQDVIKVVNRSKKVDQLHDLLIQDGFDKVIIFGRTKWGIQKLSDELSSRGFKAGAIHGNKRQSQRQRILDQFKRNEISILLATDVASRGLDIDDVSHVINYDMPQSYDDYVHRIGRTGRMNKKGIALTFVE